MQQQEDGLSDAAQVCLSVLPELNEDLTALFGLPTEKDLVGDHGENGTLSGLSTLGHQGYQHGLNGTVGVADDAGRSDAVAAQQQEQERHQQEQQEHQDGQQQATKATDGLDTDHQQQQQQQQQEVREEAVQLQQQQQHMTYLRCTAEGLLLQALTALCVNSDPSESHQQPAGEFESPPSATALKSRAPGLKADQKPASTRAAADADRTHSNQTSADQRPAAANGAAGTEHTKSDDLKSEHNSPPTKDTDSIKLGDLNGDQPPAATGGTDVIKLSGVSQRRLRAAKLGVPAVGRGTQDLLSPEPQYAPLTQRLPKESAVIHANGTAQFSDDVPVFEGALYAAWVTSTVAKGRVQSIDTTAALQVPGAVRFVGPQDIPVHPPGIDQPLFATDVTFHGEPLGLMLASSYQAAQQAARQVVVQYEQPEQPAVLSTAQALQQGSWYDLPKMASFYKAGLSPGSTMVGEVDVSQHLDNAPMQLRDVQLHLPSQAHMYMEPQTAVAEVDEDGRVRVHASTQNYDRCLRTVATMLGLPHHKVEVKCRRLGGAFGGKANNSHRIAAAAAVAAVVTGEQVRLATNRNTDMRMFAGRSAVDVTFSVGFDEEGHILALDMECLNQAGAYPNLAEFDPHAMMTVVDNAYFIPHLRAQYRLMKLNIAPRTMVRAPGDFPGILAIESVIEAVAVHLGLSPHVVRERNMRPMPPPGTEQLVNSLGRQLGAPDQYSLPRIWQELKQKARFEERMAEVEKFNASNMWRKRGLCIAPCAYPLPMGTRSAVVHIYKDGSVLVAHPGVDMGQGLTIKVLQTAAYELGQVLPPSQRPLPVSFIRAADPSTYTLPHNGITAASTTSDLACAAVRAACAELVTRLKPHADQLGPDFTWQQLITSVAPAPDLPCKVNLTAAADGDLSQQLVARPSGTPYLLTVYGAAVAEAEIDVLTGERRVISVDILFDCGRSLNPGIDLGQIEGAFTFGMGMVLGEHTEFDPDTGACTTDSTWTYKIPGVMCVPERFNVAMLKDSPLALKGPLSAKAVGEPPLLLSSTVHFALAAATRAAAQQVYGSSPNATQPLAVPATPQAIKIACGTMPLKHVMQQHMAQRL